ncbi:MAG: 6-phosphogluconate dehydrogenase [Chlorobi bacterium]|nr:6-phosphogluconate dehydrogenase [Chlorobiota bacterium]
MKKFLIWLIVILVALGGLLYAFNYYVPYSEGYRSGKLIKISRKGIIFKTWEAELSLGIGHDQRWAFSIEPKEKEIRRKLIEWQGKNVRVNYIERFWKIPWLGETKYFAKDVQLIEDDEDVPIE